MTLFRCREGGAVGRCGARLNGVGEFGEGRREPVFRVGTRAEFVVAAAYVPQDLAATRRFFTRVLDHGLSPIEVITDRAAAYPRVLEELAPAACHVTEHYGNNSIEADYGRLKSRLRAMRGLKLRCVQVITAGYVFIQKIRAAITNSVPMKQQTYGSWLPSTSSSWRSDQPRVTSSPARTPHNATAPPAGKRQATNETRAG